MYLFKTLVPVFVLIGVGYVIVKRGFISKSSVKDFNGLVYYVGLPTLLFYEIGQSSIELSSALKPLVLCLVSMAAGLAAGVGASVLRKTKPADTGSALQVIIRGNTVFIGLPVIVYFFESIHYPDISYVNNLAMLSLSVLAPIANVIGVLVLVVGRKPNKGLLKIIANSLVTNPIIFACIAGIIYSFLFDGFAVPIERTFRAMAGMTLPLSLIAVGCILAEIKIFDDYVDMSIIALIKLMLMPLAAFAAGKAMGFDGEIIGVAMILMACPSGSTCVTLAQQLDGNIKLTSSAIFSTSALSAASLVIVLIICNSLFH